VQVPGAGDLLGRELDALVNLGFDVVVEVMARYKVLASDLLAGPEALR
jgi:hypothetical protein